MPFTVDHQTIGRKVKQTQLRNLRLFVNAINVYPQKDPIFSLLVKQTKAIASLIGELKSVFEEEVSEAELEVLGCVYEFDLDGDQWEKTVGTIHGRPVSDSGECKFSLNEIKAASQLLEEVAENLDSIKRLISGYSPHHSVHKAMRNARTCNIAVGTHLGLLPKFRTAPF